MKGNWTVSIVGALLLASSTIGFASQVDTNGTWYNFKTIKGTDFGGGVDYAWNHTSFEPIYFNPGPPPWTFTAPGSGAKLTVLDGGEIGDVYNVYDNGVLIGTTSAPGSGRPCGGDPETCLANPSASRGVFQLMPGSHSITISVRTTPYPDSYVSWFRVEAGTGPEIPTSTLPVITNVVTAAGGTASAQKYIQSGSWVSIFGRNLANEEVAWDKSAGGNLPTTLGGVTVSIDGKPAFLKLVSPTQINVQAPTSRLGVVEVVVSNNGNVSQTAAVEVRTHAPAFFQWVDSRYAAAMRSSDNHPVGDPALAPLFVGIGRGKVLTFLGTGFGPSPLEPGVIATSAIPVAAPEVTIGGIRAEVISATLSPGTAGVYEITVRIPFNASVGDVPVQAEAGEVLSPEDVLVNVIRD